MRKILLTGGSGLLGKELQKNESLLNGEVDAPTHKEFDIVTDKLLVTYDLIIHAAAYTNLIKAEEEKLNCYLTNVIGTKRLASSGIPIVYISTEYSAHPVNYYSETKKEGEDVIKFFSSSYLIIRTLFKPRPFPHPQACVDQWTQGDYVDIIAPLIIERINLYEDKLLNNLVYIGTERKTTYELAQRTRPDVLPCLVEDIKTIQLPKDYQ